MKYGTLFGLAPMVPYPNEFRYAVRTGGLTVSKLIPKKDVDFLAKLNAFAIAMHEHLADVGLAPDDEAAFLAAKELFETGMTDADDAWHRWKAKCAAKNAARRAMESFLRMLVSKVGGHPNNPPEALAALDLAGRDLEPTPVVPAQPTDLVVVPDLNGVNALRWNGNGNPQGTIYVVEAMIGNSTAWEHLASLTNKRYAHMGRTLGERVVYRVKASRSSGDSLYSFTATAYESPMGANPP